MLCPGATPGGLWAQDRATPLTVAHTSCRRGTLRRGTAEMHAVSWDCALSAGGWGVLIGGGTGEGLPRALSHHGSRGTTPSDLVFPSSLLDPKDGPVLYPQNHQGMPLPVPPLWGPPPGA